MKVWENMTTKTMAMRALEAKNIPYEVLTYDATITDAALVANEVGLPQQRVFKTLVVVRNGGKPMLVMIPSNRQLNLKRLAKAVGEKKVKMASHKQAEELTGLQVGGISALALLNRGFDVYLDESADTIEKICISAGEKGLQLMLSVQDLIDVTGARLIDISGN
jgi:Cys-tRNA(Pro)/Cys-tRNA(Cys) deacylase